MRCQYSSTSTKQYYSHLDHYSRPYCSQVASITSGPATLLSYLTVSQDFTDLRKRNAFVERLASIAYHLTTWWWCDSKMRVSYNGYIRLQWRAPSTKDQARHVTHSDVTHRMKSCMFSDAWCRSSASDRWSLARNITAVVGRGTVGRSVVCDML